MADSEYIRQANAAIEALLVLNSESGINQFITNGAFRTSDGYTISLRGLLSTLPTLNSNFHRYSTQEFRNGSSVEAIKSFLYKCSHDTQAIIRERMAINDETPEQQHESPQIQESEIPEEDIFNERINHIVRDFKKSAVKKVSDHEKAVDIESGTTIALREGEPIPEDFIGTIIKLKPGEEPPKKLSKIDETLYRYTKNKREVDYKLNQLISNSREEPDKDLSDRTHDIAQREARKELQIRAREAWKQYGEAPLRDKVANLFVRNAPSGSNNPLSSIGQIVPNPTSNFIGSMGSKAASLAAQAATRVAAGVAGTVSTPATGIVIIVIVVIAILLIIFFYFYQNTFAPYNPVPIPTEANDVVAPPQGLLPPSSFTGDICPIPSKNITCTSFYDTRPGFDCHHCDASYQAIDDEHKYNCTQFHGTFYAIDIADSKGAYVYLPTIAGNKVQWTFRGSEYIDQQIQKYTGVDEKTGAQYYLQLHHTLNGSGNPGTHESGELGGRICTGSDCSHVHVQIGSGGTSSGDTIWLDTSAYMCK